ncbi:nucleolar protein 10 [Eurosta solidaginis]|uniref:nucleolar protein 10 n=1 Tax=Eurosta solidaginis TaxID=178769 RepID=UPI0035309567
MFVNEVNDIKIYNLSAGKSVPEWLTDRRKRSQLMKKVDSRRQIELIQDFDMPGVCTTIRMSPDQQYILATGTYKPRVKCYEVSNLSIKFERCFDSEVTTFEPISDDYSKLIFLQCDRFVEIHCASGRHYRLRIPRFGRDMKYHKPSCDLFIVGTTRDIYRLNLERGQFLQPYETDASCINTCDINPEHQLLVVGSKEGIVEAWDSRTKTCVGKLDVAIKLPGTKSFPSISAIKNKNGLQMGVGTASGHVLLYDIRSREPLLVKDHLNKVAVKRIAFNPNHHTVYSMDDAMLKLWDENTGKQVAYIESTTSFNDFCTIPETGMFFLAQEDIKMLTYYVPSMGPAPRWCSFLDNLTEEIESEVVENMYDDYQFVTQKELEELGLEHLIGSNLLKGYMHGYFVDVRLYNKAKAVADPFAFERFRKEKIRKEIESERKSRLQIKTNLPKVNQELALKLMDEQSNITKASSKGPNLLADTRFKAMFENPEFAINKGAEEYKLLVPVLNRLDKSKLKEVKRHVEVARVNELHAEEEKPHEESDNDEDLFGFEKSDDGSSAKSDGEESTDDEGIRDFAKEMKKAYKNVKRQREADENEADNDHKGGEGVKIEHEQSTQESNNQGSTKSINKQNNGSRNIKMTALEDNNFKLSEMRGKIMKISLKDRVRFNDVASANVTTIGRSLGNRQMTFDLKKKSSKDEKKREYLMKKHREERKKIIRPINALRLKKVNFK